MKQLSRKEGSYIIVGERYRPILDEGLNRLDLAPIYMPDNPNVDPKLAGHADLSVFYCGGKRLILAPHLKFSDFSYRLASLGFLPEYADIRQSAQYPYDTALNACLVGNKLFYSPGISAKEITDNRGYELIPVKQGYCGCSICAVDANSIITADKGIAAAAEAHGIDTLLISPGHIRLEGYEYGFIGGSGFMLYPDIMVFTGDIFSHPDAEKIVLFLKRRGIIAEKVTENKLFDIGSGIIIG